MEQTAALATADEKITTISTPRNLYRAPSATAINVTPTLAMGIATLAGGVIVGAVFTALPLLAIAGLAVLLSGCSVVLMLADAAGVRTIRDEQQRFEHAQAALAEFQRACPYYRVAAIIISSGVRIELVEYVPQPDKETAISNMQFTRRVLENRTFSPDEEEAAFEYTVECEEQARELELASHSEHATAILSKEMGERLTAHINSSSSSALSVQ